MEFFISKVVENKKFFNPEEFGWIASVESKYPQIRSELMKLLENYNAIPEFKNLSDEQERIVAGNKWKTFMFYVSGAKIEKNCRLCPVTTEAVEGIPGMVAAFYSVFEPHTRLIEHRGPYKGVLRYHLGLKVPAEKEKCSIRVVDEVRSWEEGKSLVFDDSFMHEAHNDSDEIRVVLFVDFLRPMKFPFSIINKGLVWLFRQSPFIQKILKRV